MTFGRRMLLAAIGTALVAGSAAAATNTLHDAEIISVAGKSLIVRDGTRASDYTVTGGADFTVDGAPATLATLRPGMKVSGSFESAPPVPMSLVELHDAYVAYSLGGNLIVGTGQPDTYLHFSGSGMAEQGVLMYRSGQLVPVNALLPNDRISATIVTKFPPKEMSSNDLTAFIESEKRKPAIVHSIANTPKVNRFAANVVREPEAATASTTPAAAAPQATPQPSATSPDKASPPAPAAQPASPKKLPKTGSRRPLVGLTGLVLAGLGAVLTLRRRLSAAS